ncbi:hypothetical protein J6590_017322 [Homalodisca vitripennis]|nr:hypothetical protein J6590_017322 [Homalodisca vitripennis]
MNFFEGTSSVCIGTEWKIVLSLQELDQQLSNHDGQLAPESDPQVVLQQRCGVVSVANGRGCSAPVSELSRGVSGRDVSTSRDDTRHRPRSITRRYLVIPHTYTGSGAGAATKLALGGSLKRTVYQLHRAAEEERNLTHRGGVV